jgi:hypothetical protein
MALALVVCSSVSHGAEPLFTESFDGSSPGVPQPLLEAVSGRGNVLHLSVPADSMKGKTITLSLPVEKLRGQRVFVSADVKVVNVSPKPNSWNGVKVMLVLDTPSGRSYPQPEIPIGTVDWQKYSTSLTIPETTTSAELVLGLEQVTGEVWFDNLRVVPRASLASVLKVDPARPIFRGHSLPRLRGAMAGNSLIEDHVKHFGVAWNGNLLRLQIFESARQDRPLDAYDTWLEERLRYIDRVLQWCERYGVMALIDLHSPPGGQAFSAGYITARGRIFTDPAAQAKFVEVWERMAHHYKGHPAIWGFDLVNEPDDSMVTEECLDWNTLADKTARAIRAIDPERTLIIEPNGWGGPDGFASFLPLDLPNVIYSFHFYQPMKFTHQGIHGNPSGVSYPGMVADEHWDQARLERAMKPAIDFAEKYRVHMYVGEFSAIRIAPPGSAAKYLGDVIEILEQHGLDWSYHAYREWHGWSLEHEGTMEKPEFSSSPTDRQQVVTGWFAKNMKP